MSYWSIYFPCHASPFMHLITELKPANQVKFLARWTCSITTLSRMKIRFSYLAKWWSGIANQRGMTGLDQVEFLWVLLSHLLLDLCELGMSVGESNSLKAFLIQVIALPAGCFNQLMASSQMFNRSAHTFNELFPQTSGFSRHKKIVYNCVCVKCK